MEYDIVRSTPEDIAGCEALVERVIAKIKALKANGMRVHIIWDFDGVLGGARDEDVFTVLNYDVPTYYAYQERLFRTLPEDGPWARVADLCGTLHDSQDIVTARSRFAPLRAYAWLTARRLSTRWMMFVGHQSKSGAYGIILESFEDDPRTHILTIDDSARHVQDFGNTAVKYHMTHQAEAIWTPRIRLYDEKEIKREAQLVLGFKEDSPRWVSVRKPTNTDPGRVILVSPDPEEGIRNMFKSARTAAPKPKIPE